MNTLASLTFGMLGLGAMRTIGRLLKRIQSPPTGPAPAVPTAHGPAMPREPSPVIRACSGRACQSSCIIPVAIQPSTVSSALFRLLIDNGQRLAGLFPANCASSFSSSSATSSGTFERLASNIRLTGR